MNETQTNDIRTNDTPRQEDQRNDYLRLSLVPGVGPKIFEQLLERFESPANVLAAAPSDLRSVSGVGPKLARQISLATDEIDIAPHLELCRKNNVRIVDRKDAAYPKLLKQIHNPPNILYMHGEVVAQDELAIAIVGSRHATAYGKRIADRLARGLAMAGFTIISGLARGIDAAAHRGALAAGGRTIAVLGSGVMNIYPPEHTELALDVRKNGAVISEQPPTSQPKSGSFPQRNRIVTGMSLGTVIVEAAERSGALISARLAMEQDREVFAVPGQIDSRMSRGCHKLIRDGAKLVESVDDVLEELGPLATPTTTPSGDSVRHPAELQLNDQERLVLQAIAVEPTELEAIIDVTELPAHRILSTISVLEIRRLIRRISGTAVVRI